MFSVTPFFKSPNPTMGGEATPYSPGSGYAAGAGNPNAPSDSPALDPESVAGKPGSPAWAQNLVATNGNPLGGVYSQPGAFGNPAGPAPGQTNIEQFALSQSGRPVMGPQQNPFANPSFRNDLSGYNPSQYATTETANNLAQQLGGATMQTRNANNSPLGPPPQNMIDFGGADMLNAGLLAERYAKYDRATADAMTRAELAQMGPRSAPTEDSEGGTLGSWSQYQPVSGGQSFLGQGANLGSSLGATSRVPERGGTTPGFNPRDLGRPLGGGPARIDQHTGGSPFQFQNPNMWASRYSGYRIPYGNRRYYPGMGAAPRFQPRQDFFQPRPPLAWY